LPVEEFEQAIAFDQTPSQSDIEQPDNTFPVERKRPALELFDAAHSGCSSDHRSHGAPCEVVWCNTLLGKCAQHADMRPAACRATAQRQPYGASPGHDALAVMG
jgi:hypothetical protein